MPTKEFSVYNETRESFLSSRVSVIDTKSDPLNLLKALIEGPAPNAQTGLWLNPLKNIPTVPRLSSYDLVYLDQDCRVIHGVELVPDNEVPHFNGQAASALVLPFHSFASSQTLPGDQVIICAAEETEHLSAPIPVLALPAPAPQSTWLLAEQSSADIGIDPPLLGALSSEPQAAMQQLEAREKVQRLSRKSESSKIRPWRALARLRVHISISIAPVPAAKTAPSRSGRWTAQWGSLKTRCTGRSRELMHQYARPSVTKWSRSWARKSVSLRIRCWRWAEEFLRQYGRPFIASISTLVAQGTRPRTRKWGSLKIRCTGWPVEFLHSCTRLLVATIPGLAAQGTRSMTRKWASWKVWFGRWSEEFIYGPERVAARTTFPGAQGAEFPAPDKKH